MYLEKFDLTGRIAVVTGAGQGIGEACATALAEAGATVVVADMDAARVEACVARLKEKGYAAHGATMDVTRSAEVAALADKVVADHGRVDILVNNAGVAKSDVRAEDTSDEHWRFHMDVNLDGLFWCCREFGRKMLEAGSGSIVNIGSMSGFIVNKPQPQSFYNASKAAVHHLTKSLAAEWGQRGVRVNAVAPTYIETPLTKFGIEEDPDMYKVWLEMTPMGRVGQPDEIASVVHFLASDASSLMTGSIVLADGGYTCW
ncbi:MAG: SDR family oxidoreductase [Aurantimonas endophytica]|jgi:NAD(P)-dependent dehydrogenase (short-subunit alcohol dehydrogenase family)|uniref:NAD(P)-dependent dehydrogenase (Short-subunit alcohol dehydrogenase family) n=1 Tax=Aurantimonas endophytica TaxID=1522175 RepID=A0A7W6MQ50_9HYPH|nr:SDR family oxidoreductase [Aurantimonas endophytica]MBB4003589.1 NAD(P)-dependent dehydrogenase (short-subunit alcohol dehydrogenase family) [Aurantimonas endophytica]MCO6404447.1 SDR family oxidoreductase [Aurantimonas endophytica]